MKILNNCQTIFEEKMKKTKTKNMSGDRRYREVCRLLDHLILDFGEVRDEIAILKHQIDVIKSYVILSKPTEVKDNGNI